MKINGYKPTGEVFKAYQQNKVDKNKSNKASQPAADSVQLSHEAKFKKEIENTLKELPEVREDIVNKLKKEIQAGTYKPDAHKIADGILQERLLDKEI
ncbi:putative anti-sigma-28 factor, FlgM [Desulforamulus reducens MI-1]|uniref:Negative regulator of flagellin synthesis n=1 Tax=Desulforamulus reducens (strain ATCC BAA-1160 / DSM 100696 / MI-1) TaxID=349161 RepID=A4J795_DESRM|nr:flagellar biosynthesis anti-sigma factor FlgM [Desulforamulus reducens]ABO50948.1 putative anti-sigma-28 factor, FlgM [Desulforamulus reducens MI-1]